MYNLSTSDSHINKLINEIVNNNYVPVYYAHIIIIFPRLSAYQKLPM